MKAVGPSCENGREHEWEEVPVWCDTCRDDHDGVYCDNCATTLCLVRDGDPRSA